MWSNFHTHSEYCDGKGCLEDYVLKSANVVSLGFSSHAPVPFDCKWCMKKEKLSAYLTEIDDLRLRSEINLYKGLEVDFIPGIIAPSQFRDRLDYTIGSIHFVDAYPDGRHWEIDGQHASFLDGLRIIFKNDIRAAISRYFELTREMIVSDCPNIVGHIDKIKIQNVGDKFFMESDSWYQSEISKTLEVVKEAGVIVEVNTRGLYQKKSSTSYPSPWIIERMRSKEIPIVLSSDAHHPDDLVNCFAETASMLNRAGYRQLHSLTAEGWQTVNFNENGILLERHRI